MTQFLSNFAIVSIIFASVLVAITPFIYPLSIAISPILISIFAVGMEIMVVALLWLLTVRFPAQAPLLATSLAILVAIFTVSIITYEIFIERTSTTEFYRSLGSGYGIIAFGCVTLVARKSQKRKNSP